MFLLHWLKRATRRGGAQPSRRAPLTRFQPRVEILEERSVPTILTVTTAADNALAPPPGSLRTALASAGNGDTINFAPDLAGQTIALQGTAFPTLTITQNVTITSGGVPGIVISGSNAATVFTVGSGVTATIDSLTISNGMAQPSGPNGVSQGGGILNNGSLTVSACTLTGNQAVGGPTDEGGGIANLGTLTVINSTIANNGLATNASASSGGGGIFSSGTLTAINCTIVNNSTFGGSGGGLDVSATATVLNTIVANNAATIGVDVAGTLTSASNDLFSTAPNIAGGTANLINTNPGLDPNGLQNNGGPTQTIAQVQGQAGQSDSPGIGKGNPAFVTNPPFQGPPFDQRGFGFSRIVVGFETGSRQTDIGAVEDQTPNTHVSLVFDPFAGTGFTGGTRTAVGDVTGDGIPDLIVGSGPGGIGVVLVYDGASVLANPFSPTLIGAFYPFGPTFRGGVNVAVANLDGGPTDEIIIAADAGGGPQVNIYSAAQIQAHNFANPAVAFFAYTPSFTGGVRLAVGDVNGDGKADLITAAGPGGRPEVNIYFGTASGGFIAGAGQVLPTPDLALFALGPTLTGYAGGIYVTALDINGDGKADLFCGAGSGSCEVTLFSGAQLTGPSPNLSPLTAFFAPSYFIDYSLPNSTGVSFTGGADVSSTLTATAM